MVNFGTATVPVRQRTKGPALILVPNGGWRVAAFVWWTKEGIAWMEPDYLEPDRSGTGGFHAFAGTYQGDENSGVVLTEKPGVFAVVFDAEANASYPDAFPGERTAYIERFNRMLTMKGTTWEKERTRVARSLKEDFSFLGGLAR